MKPFEGLPKWASISVGVSILGLFLLGCLPAIMSGLGYPYLPSVEWVEQSRPATWVFGALMAASFIVAIGLRLWASETLFERFKTVLLLLFCVPFGWFIGTGAVTMGAPMIGAWVVGTETQLPYVVTDTTGRGGRKCERPVELAGLPFSFDKICGLPDDFRRSFAVGDKIMVNGSGTTLGIYVESANRPR